VHPRPDERHIRYQDVLDLKKVITTEFNIEGYPDERYLDLVETVIPHQATLVPDTPQQITSNAGWDTVKNREFLDSVIRRLKRSGIRVSVFVDPAEDMIRGAVDAGADRVELYTEPYASAFHLDRENAVRPYVLCSDLAHELHLGINAGHDLDQKNLKFFNDKLPYLDEVSIGHALVCDSLYLGFENTIQLYLRQLR